MKTQVQAMDVMFRSQQANLAKFSRQQTSTVQVQKSALQKFEEQIREREDQVRRHEQLLVAHEREYELAQTCLRYHRATTGLDRVLSKVMEAFRSALHPTQWNSFTFVPGSRDVVTIAERINLVGALYSHVMGVNPDQVQIFFSRWQPWRNNFSHTPMVQMTPAEDMRVIVESEGVLAHLTELVSRCIACTIPNSEFVTCFLNNRVFWGNR